MLPLKLERPSLATGSGERSMSEVTAGPELALHGGPRRCSGGLAQSTG